MIPELRSAVALSAMIVASLYTANYKIHRRPFRILWLLLVTFSALATLITNDVFWRGPEAIIPATIESLAVYETIRAATSHVEHGRKEAHWFILIIGALLGLVFIAARPLGFRGDFPTVTYLLRLGTCIAQCASLVATMLWVKYLEVRYDREAALDCLAMLLWFGANVFSYHQHVAWQGSIQLSVHLGLLLWWAWRVVRFGTTG